MTVIGTPRKLVIGGGSAGTRSAADRRIDVGDPERAVLADDQAQQAVALGQGADPAPRGVVHPARDEALDPAVGIDDAEGRVLGADQGPHAVDDDLQDVVNGRETCDLADRRIQGGVDWTQVVRWDDVRIEHRRRG